MSTSVLSGGGGEMIVSEAASVVCAAKTKLKVFSTYYLYTAQPPEVFVFVKITNAPLLMFKKIHAKV